MELKEFEELTLDEKANLRNLYQIAKKLPISKHIILLKPVLQFELQELFIGRECTTIAGIYAVLKHTKFVKYIYIAQVKNTRKNGEK
jgi:hypothetical protein